MTEQTKRRLTLAAMMLASGLLARGATPVMLPVNLHGQNPLAGTPDIVLPDQTGSVVVLPNLTK